VHRSSHVYAPLLAAAAVTALSGCHEAPPLAAAWAEAASEIRVGGFGASFSNNSVFWWFAFAGVIVVAGRYTGAGG
jgi:hypothetical protein